MEKQTITIGGQVYILPPFTAGQMRRLVRPILEEARALQKEAQAIPGGDGPEVMAAMVDITVRSQEIMERQAEAAVQGLNNTYPKLKLEDIEELLTPLQMANLFNRLVAVATEGSNEPGEAAPQKRKGR